LKAGDTVRISTATSPELTGAMTAIGGSAGALVHEHKTSTFRGLQPRHPRTAIGWNKTHYFLVEVDGRQKTSAGMTFPELATYMLNLGCDEAINLDGGGSATMWVYGNVMNSPSEGHERPAANALVVVRKNQSH
jgi:exopolysaccharide biosynthesis protein